MTVVEIRDREVIAEFCRRRPAVHAYELGDLDDFFWPHTRWLGWETDGRVEQLALLYGEPDPPVLLALAERPEQGMADLLRSIATGLPPQLYAHLSPGLLGALEPRLVPASEPVAHRKLGLVEPSRLDGHDTGQAELLSSSDLHGRSGVLRQGVPGNLVPASDAGDRPLRRHPSGRRARVRRRCARVVADVGRRNARERGHPAVAARSGTGEGGVRPAVPDACSRTGST